MKDKNHLDFENLGSQRILITGASGWLGRESLCMILQSNPRLSNLEITLGGSQKGSFLVHDARMEVTPIREISVQKRFDLILHFAFATQDKVQTLGAVEYVARNLELNEWISDISASNLEAKKLILSSGAVSKFPNPNYDGTSMEIYAKLKRDLESRFTDSNSLILRLWNTSGHHLGADQKYAISNFISMAVNNHPIIVGKNLKRTYVAASSVMKASLSFLFSGGVGIVNSGGERTTLFDLAHLTKDSLKSQSVITLAETGEFPDLDYTSPVSEIPEAYWDENLNLREQIRTVADGI